MNNIVRKWDDFCKKDMKVITEKDGTRTALFENFSVSKNLFKYKTYYISGYLEVVYEFDNNDKFRGPSLPFSLIIRDAPSIQKALNCFHKIIDMRENEYNSGNRKYPFGASGIIIMDETIDKVKNISFVECDKLVKFYDIPEYDYFDAET